MKSKFIYLSWLLSTIATIGSLYFSNVLELPPCSLCWWQRICMFPLVILFAIGFIKKDNNCIYYTTPLVTGGLFISIYHNLLYYGVIESFTACTSGLSCTSKQIEWFGLITIPLLALLTFTLLTIITIYSTLNYRNSHEEK
ncbi:MAG: disulfide bond formation protein B [Bacteriovorax sp.]|nr:disulfide bond formation protein B [Bacteriovorax sp.]